MASQSQSAPVTAGGSRPTTSSTMYAATQSLPPAAGASSMSPQRTIMRRYRKPGWDSRIHYSSMANTDHHSAFRSYFTPDRPDVHRVRFIT